MYMKFYFFSLCTRKKYFVHEVLFCFLNVCGKFSAYTEFYFISLCRNFFICPLKSCNVVYMMGRSSTSEAELSGTALEPPSCILLLLYGVHTRLIRGMYLTRAPRQHTLLFLRNLADIQITKY